MNKSVIVLSPYVYNPYGFLCILTCLCALIWPLAFLMLLQLPAVKDYVASVSLLAPYGLEPVSEDFKRTIGNSTLLSQKMAQPYTAKQHHLKCCAQPAFKPAFWFKHQVKEWTRLERSLVATAKALHTAHDAGALFRQVQWPLSPHVMDFECAQRLYLILTCLSRCGMNFRSSRKTRGSLCSWCSESTIYSPRMAHWLRCVRILRLEKESIQHQNFKLLYTDFHSVAQLPLLILVQVPRLLSLNEHLEDLIVPRAGHNLLHEHHAALSMVAQRLKAFVREKHRLFLDASSAHM